MEDSNGRDYEVGYRRPPRHTRFKKGQSGNPKGRPRGSRRLAQLLNKALSRTVVVNEHGRQRRITMLEAIFAQPVTKAARGDQRAIQLLLLYQLPEMGKHILGSRRAGGLSAATEERIRKALLGEDFAEKFSSNDKKRRERG
jgi:Family of unknown function (DUF5681)